MTNVAGKPVPLPEAMPSGITPPMTPSGAAAATTMNTIAPTPRLPRRVRPDPDGALPEVSGAAMVSDMGDRPFVVVGYCRIDAP